MITTYHPQTDVHIEMVNKIIRDLYEILSIGPIRCVGSMDFLGRMVV